MPNTDQLTNYVGAFVDELTRMGVKNVVISPGSRSTPLAILMSDHEQLQTHVLIDERSSAFFALGIAKASKNPVAIVCTSGSAAANYYPAIVEANHSNVPLIVITTDRPHELRDIGAPQAMNQTELYHNFTYYFHDMAIPENCNEMISYARTIAYKGVEISRKRRGPVQINMPFREPLLPNCNKEDRFTVGIRNRMNTETSLFNQKLKVSQQFIENFSQLKNVLVVAGDMQNEDEQNEIVHICNELHIPLLADPLSQLRHGDVIDSYDLFLRDEIIQEKLKADCIIRIGAYPVSKVLGQFLKKQDIPQWYIGETEKIPDPAHKITNHLACSPLDFFQELQANDAVKNDSYETKWKTLQRISGEYLEDISPSLIHEGLIIREAIKNMEECSSIFVSNSMPIRDVDIFFRSHYKKLKIYANRGVNGIDGIISTALGVAFVEQECLLITGDLSFYHDLNGLLAAKKYNLSLKVLLINNDGGGIFSFLPQSKEEKYFEELYGTPIALPFRPIVEAYGGNFSECTTIEQLHHFIKSPYNGLQVLEVKTNRKENYLEHQRVQFELKALLKDIEL